MRPSIVKFFILGLLAVVLAGQAPRVGDIEFYGLQRLSADKLKQTLKLKEGDPLPPSKGDLEDRLEELSGVVRARVEAVCCQEGKVVLFIGVEEKGAPHFAFRSQPAGQAVLPAAAIQAYGKFMEAVEAAARKGKMAEDLTRGHSFMADPDAREQQEKFAVIARDNLPLLRQVLREAADEEQRAMAALMIGYASDKKAIMDDLQYAIQDPDEAVRANAMRSLTAIAVLTAKQPALEIHIAPTWLVEMLNSVVLSDRLRAATALVTLTEQDGAKTLDQIRARAQGSLVEMARWKALEYALPAYMLVARMAGLNGKEIEEAWTKGQRETVIDRLLASRTRRKSE